MLSSEKLTFTFTDSFYGRGYKRSYQQRTDEEHYSMHHANPILLKYKNISANFRFCCKHYISNVPLITIFLDSLWTTYSTYRLNYLFRVTYSWQHIQKNMNVLKKHSVKLNVSLSYKTGNNRLNKCTRRYVCMWIVSRLLKNVSLNSSSSSIYIYLNRFIRRKR